MGCGESQGAMRKTSTHSGVVVRLVWGKGECSEEAVSEYPHGLGSQKEKQRGFAFLWKGPGPVGLPRAWYHQPLFIMGSFIYRWDVVHEGWGELQVPRPFSQEQEGIAGGRQPKPLLFGSLFLSQVSLPKMRSEKNWKYLCSATL